jgi:hypothetical protein
MGRSPASAVDQSQVRQAPSKTFGLPTGVSLGTHPLDSSGYTGIITASGTMNWPGALFWIDGMNLANYLGYSDWRLPTVSPISGSTFDLAFSNNATTDLGYAPTTTGGTDGGWRDASGNPVSEMGYMYYVNLGNLGSCAPDNGDPSGCAEQTG